MHTTLLSVNTVWFNMLKRRLNNQYIGVKVRFSSSGFLPRLENVSALVMYFYIIYFAWPPIKFGALISKKKARKIYSLYMVGIT